MKKFMDTDFLLDNDVSQILYNDHAKDLPIFDFHNHLSTQEIADDITYENITDAWLSFDHYKWRVMRSCGVDENLISGEGDPKERFAIYARAISRAIGNPLYHWSHLELRRYFGIEEIICPDNTDIIWEKSKEALKDLSVRKLIKMSNVHTLCTTDNPVDTLEAHQSLVGNDDLDVAVRPAFRPDPAFSMDKSSFDAYIDKLGESADVEIRDFDTLKQALHRRLDYFQSVGCLSSDHDLNVLEFIDTADQDADKILKRKLAGEAISTEDAIRYRSAVLCFLASEYHVRGMVMMLHIGAIRNTNEYMYQKLGPDRGYDAIHDAPVASALRDFLNAIEQSGGLPKTVLFCLNPKDNYVLLSIGGGFLGDIEGKVQFGPAWWYNDHLEGMEKHLMDLSTLSVLGSFIGMLTDSRSFLSFPRHEYFRRILCNYVGKKVVKGEIPWDEKWLGGIIKDICFDNALKFFEG